MAHVVLRGGDRNHAAQLAIVMQMSRQESRSSAGPDHVTLQAVITWLIMIIDFQGERRRGRGQISAQRNLEIENSIPAESPSSSHLPVHRPRSSHLAKKPHTTQHNTTLSPRVLHP